MEIIEFYNSIVDITKNTGQGVPMFIVYKYGLESDVEKMIQDGLLVRYTKHNTYVSDNDTVCINGVYNPEKEEYSTKGVFMNSLHFIRRWLEIDQTNDVTFKLFEGKTGEEAYAEWVEASKEAYFDWIRENVEGLEAIKTLKHLTKSDYKSTNFDVEVIEYIKTRGWYKDNESISECKEKSKEQLDLTKLIIPKKQEMVKLLQSANDEKYSEDIVKYQKEIKEDETELALREAIDNLLPSNSSESIQEFISNLTN